MEDRPQAPQIQPGDSLDAALRAAGAGVLGIDLVMSDKASQAFCGVRPPGHHATMDQGMGFCLLNNVAIAARYLQQNWQIERVGIIDFDVHHGNGTEAAFASDETVFFLSSHRWPFYPGTGGPDAPELVATRSQLMQAQITYLAHVFTELRYIEAVLGLDKFRTSSNFLRQALRTPIIGWCKGVGRCS